jgi:hypothetical protein
MFEQWDCILSIRRRPSSRNRNPTISASLHKKSKTFIGDENVLGLEIAVVYVFSLEIGGSLG